MSVRENLKEFCEVVGVKVGTESTEEDVVERRE